MKKIEISSSLKLFINSEDVSIEENEINENFLINIIVAIKEKTKLPITPEYVFLGLILVNLGPLKILPNVYPPMSVKIQIINIIKITSNGKDILNK